MLHTIGTLIFVMVVLVVPATLAQRPNNSVTPEFYVQITTPRSVLYADEGVSFDVMKLAGKKFSANCRFGDSGTVQILRNGSVITSLPTGPVSLVGTSSVKGVKYGRVGGGIPSHYFYESDRIGPAPDEVFQLRATCGDDVSEPSRPFRFSEWNEPVDGLQVLAVPLKKAYKVGEPIRMKVTMRNTGSKSKWCPVPLPEDAYPRSFWVLEPHWTDSRSPVDDKLVYSRGLRTLKPGESQTAIFVLNHYKDSHIDRYRIFGSERGKLRLWLSVFLDHERTELPAKYRTNLWRGRELESNAFEIVIE